jgi:broad specificity phosphatase PhoE
MKRLWLFLLSLFLGTHVYAVDTNSQKIVIIRHGEADNNIQKIYNSDPTNPKYTPANLTEKGKRDVQQTARNLLSQGFNNNNITAVFVSPLPRTQQTAEILVKEGVISPDKIITDKRIIELQAGDLEGKPVISHWESAFASQHHAESAEDVKSRVNDFYQSLLQHNPSGNIIVITHALPAQDLIELIAHENVSLQPGQAKTLPLHSLQYAH